eukprot:6263898-Amphidinium_carterae.1
MKEDSEHRAQRIDVAGWYSRKDNDYQYQIKAGRLGGDHRTITVGQYMELKVAYKQKHKTVIENKGEYKQNHFHDYSIITTPTNLNDDYAVKMTIEIYVQAQSKRDLLNPAHQNRFFIFLVQHYGSRLKNIFKRAGATMEEYNAVLATAEEREQSLQRISRLPEMQPTQKTQSIAKEDENDVNDNFDERSTTRASGSTGVKRKMSGEMTDKEKKMQAKTST